LNGKEVSIGGGMKCGTSSDKGGLVWCVGGRENQQKQKQKEDCAFEQEVRI
jgi:hypothetical protein